MARQRRILHQLQRKKETNTPAAWLEDNNLETGKEVEILLVLTTADNFQKNSWDILKKPEKLDVIEQTANNFQATLIKLERRIQSLETSHADTKREVESFEESI